MRSVDQDGFSHSGQGEGYAGKHSPVELKPTEGFIPKRSIMAAARPKSQGMALDCSSRFTGIASSQSAQ